MVMMMMRRGRRHAAHGRHIVLLEYDGHVVGQAVQIVAAHEHVGHLLEVGRLSDDVVEQRVVVARLIVLDVDARQVFGEERFAEAFQL